MVGGMESSRQVVSDVHVLPLYVVAPGFGTIPVNAFVIKSASRSSWTPGCTRIVTSSWPP